MCEPVFFPHCFITNLSFFCCPIGISSSLLLSLLLPYKPAHMMSFSCTLLMLCAQLFLLDPIRTPKAAFPTLILPASLDSHLQHLAPEPRKSVPMRAARCEPSSEFEIGQKTRKEMGGNSPLHFLSLIPATREHLLCHVAKAGIGCVSLRTKWTCSRRD